MREKQFTIPKRIVMALSAFFAFIGRAIKSAGRFFAACAVAFTGLFRRKSDSDDSGFNADETQIFASVDTPRRGGRPAHDQPHKTRELPQISSEHLSGEGKEHINMFAPRRHSPNILVGVLLTSFKLILIGIFMIGAAGFGSIVGVARAYIDTTPKLNTAEIENQSETSYIYDCNGGLITTYTGSENRDWASIDEIPEILQNAVISIEDVRFKYHSGVDIKRLIGAFINNLMNSNVQGGSTITQQIIKNNLLSTERTYKRKIQEAYLAMQLETKYTKPQILEAYLNTMPMGASNYGVKAAALDYFGKELSELTLRESAMLAGITRYPYAYNPRRCYYVIDDPDKVNDRTDNVLEQMYKAGYITKDQYDEALGDKVYVLEKSTVNEMYEMPYFVEYAVYDVITHLLAQRHKQDTDENRAEIDRELRTNGYRIYTTVDPSIQKTVEQTLAEWDKYPKLKDSDDSVTRFENKDGSVSETIQPQAAVVVVDQHTGELKAVVGGRTTPTARKTLNRVYQNPMPVGSSMKPIAVYAPAIDKGYSDGTVVPNLDLPIEGWDSEDGFPSGGSKLYGPVTLRTGIVNSLNSATAYTLLNLVGLDDSYNYLIQMGIPSSHVSKTGSGLALGSSSITPIEMAGAYATIANGGVYLEPLSFTRVVDKDGAVILDADKIRDKRQVFKESTAWIVSDMLVNAVQEGTGSEARIDGMTVGGKTGTNQNVRGVFFAGITPYYTSTLWIGHDHYKSLDKSVYASDFAAPLWREYMKKILDGKPNAPISDKTAVGLGLIKKTVCSVSGKLATEACQQDPGGHKPVEAWLAPGTEPTENCDVHQIFTVCSASGKIATTFCPSDTHVQKSLVLLQPDSVYLKLTAAKLAKYLPGAMAAPEGTAIEDLSPGTQDYYKYYCDVHTADWYSQQQQLSEAKSSASSQISASRAVLSDPMLAMSMEDWNSLSAKIGELEALIAAPGSTAGAIEQKTAELKTLTDRLVSIYTPPEEPAGP